MGGGGHRNPTCKMFVLVFMATKAAVPPTAAAPNETADAANTGMPKAHQPKQTHKQAREEPAHYRAHKAQAHVNAGTAQARHRHSTSTKRHNSTARRHNRNARHT